ncbi:hypothetical protein [Micromonospora cathayae]|uniref:Thymidylate kinase n=1 Tax=Micromonospora cathayae TaxID=3028804 RepID=A0ABY7ZMJ2_9ACTN|nr:hypothetical protein [Micromonospora sp. HUAS 3]WDZ83124.1 hypothetical protein PVK37_22005 [Micromonospora sp. HUAS 3]
MSSSDPTAPAPRPPAAVGGYAPFWVLLGPDYAGKSSVLTAVSDTTGWAAVSYDDGLLDPGLPLISRLRDDIVPEALRGAADRYSPDLVLSVLQTAVVFLRDQALRQPGSEPVLVDSYYYKILAKCRLAGLVNDVLFDWWRSFPAPRGVIYLDTDVRTAWRRSASGDRLNRFEHYGARPGREAFERFQADLRREMFAEVRGLPTFVVESDADIDVIARRVEQIVRRNNDPDPDLVAADPVPA